MVEIFKHPLFAALVGVAFTVGFAPWLARRWQDLQRQREVRNELVADVSRCIMSLVAVLERRNHGTEADRVTAWRSGISSTRRHKHGNHPAVAARKEELAKAILTFDIDRCVIGTKLETYFLDRSLATRWTTFADELRLFSLGSISPNLEGRLYPGFSKDFINMRKEAAAKAADDRERWVDAEWGATEQLFLARKRELLTSVREDPMTQQSRYTESSIRCFIWASISFISLCLALIGMKLADNLPGDIAFAILWGIATASGIILLTAGLRPRTDVPLESERTAIATAM